MKIEKTVDGNAVMLSLGGWLDALSAPEFEAAFRAIEPSVTDVVLDFRDLEYISSAGMRQIVLAQKEMDKRGSLTLVRLPEAIREVFRITGLYERFTVLS